MLKVINVVGARPNFVKVAPLVEAMKRREREFTPLLVHTGQHYDQMMSDAFLRDLDLPAGHPRTREKIEKILAQKPRHWLDWYQGRFWNFEGGPGTFVPCTLTDDQVREVNAMTHVENELIDEACGRVLAAVAAAEACLDVRDLHSQFYRHQRARQSRIHVANHQDPVGFLAQ